MLIVRRASEWLAEVFLSAQELRGQHEGLAEFIWLQVGGLCAVLLAIHFEFEVLAVTCLWACSPLAGCLRLRALWRETGQCRVSFCALQKMLPHFGSTFAIGVSVYVFRLSIVFLAGKQLAGDLFAAFALGGMLGAVFSQALGPSMVHQELLQGRTRHGRFIQLFNALLLCLALLGITLALVAWTLPELLAWTTKSEVFWAAAGCSLAGGTVMVRAQSVRLRLLQHGQGRDVFGSDVLANLVLVACVPSMFFFLGEQYLATLYLVGALLSLVFYCSEDWRGVSGHWLCGSSMASGRADVGKGRPRGRLVLMVGLFAPVFVQVGSGLYSGGSYFTSGGDFALLPVPVSVLFCFLGILFLAGYAQVRVVLVVVFLTFLGLWLSTLVTSTGSVHGVERSNLVLLVQYMIPVFGLVLGAQAGGEEGALMCLARALLGVLVVVLPLQLIATWWRDEALLSSSALFFGVYQHLQYVPVIVCGAFLIALYTLWGGHRNHAWLLITAGLAGGYAALSMSMLAWVLLAGGTLVFLLRIVVLKAWSVRVTLLVALMALGASSGFMYMSDSQLLAAKSMFPHSAAMTDVIEPPPEPLVPVVTVEAMAPQVAAVQVAAASEGVQAAAPVIVSEAVTLPVQAGPASIVAPRNLVERMGFWRFYLDGVQESWAVFLFGHPEPPARNLFPSAHNYYLDFVYNFGLVAMLPLLALILLTFYKVLTNLGRIFAEPGILAVTGVVAFILLVDNSLKVGMRQPYPGIASFFLWGFLLAWLSRSRMHAACRKGCNPSK